jgi:prepilin-type N-terminal cleavage/methylation domain-containing protein
MRRRSAFTLIEILVVVFIVSMLAVVAISSFGAARQKAKTSLIVDTLINTLSERQNLARSGKGASPMCYGIYFDNTIPQQIKLVTAPYVSVAVQTETADFCDMNSPNVVLEDLNLLENFTIVDVNALGSSNNKYLIMFKPPRADVSVGTDLRNLQSLYVGAGNTATSLISIEFQSPDGLEKRAVGFDVTTGRAYEITQSESNAT